MQLGNFYGGGDRNLRFHFFFVARLRRAEDRVLLSCVALKRKLFLFFPPSWSHFLYFLLFFFPNENLIRLKYSLLFRIFFSVAFPQRKISKMKTVFVKIFDAKCYCTSISLSLVGYPSRCGSYLHLPSALFFFFVPFFSCFSQFRRQESLTPFSHTFRVNSTFSISKLMT